MREIGFSAAGERLDALFLRPEGARLLYVLAHGAGAGMRHPWLQRMAEALAEEGAATFRYHFPYVQAGRRRPDPPAMLRDAVRAAVFAAREAAPDLPLIAGGKSMGGRMTTQAQAEAPLPAVRGIALLGFPLHPADAPTPSLDIVARFFLDGFVAQSGGGSGNMGYFDLRALMLWIRFRA